MAIQPETAVSTGSQVSSGTQEAVPGADDMQPYVNGVSDPVTLVLPETPEDVEEEELLTHKSKEMVQLASKVRAVEAQLIRSNVDATLDVGALIYRARHQLIGDEFESWIMDLGRPRRTVYRYLSLFQLSRKRPDITREWKMLGLTKLYMLLEAPSDAWDAILESLPPEKMVSCSAVRFHGLVEPHVPKDNKEKKSQTPGQAGYRFSQRVKSWRTHLESAIRFGEQAGFAEVQFRKELDLFTETLRTLEARLEAAREE